MLFCLITFNAVVVVGGPFKESEWFVRGQASDGRGGEVVGRSERSEHPPQHASHPRRLQGSSLQDTGHHSVVHCSHKDGRRKLAGS